MTIKLCKDCKWYRKFRFFNIIRDKRFDYCVNPNFLEGINVDGVGYTDDSNFCHLKRLDSTTCGPEGKWWEAKNENS